MLHVLTHSTPFLASRRYEGIFEFLQTADVIGNIISRLPIIGPIRQQILTTFKRELDRTLGSQVKDFLGSYSRLATEQLSVLILSEDNAKSFSSARRRLGEEVLKRSVSSLVPSDNTIEEFVEAAWDISKEPLPLRDEVTDSALLAMLQRGDHRICFTPSCLAAPPGNYQACVRPDR